MAMNPSTRANVILTLTDKMSPALRKVSAKLDRMAVRSRRAGMAMGAAAVALGTGLFQASKSAVTLDNNMREVQARVNDITPDGLVMLREEAEKLGRETRYTTGQVSAMMAELAKAGVSQNSIKAMTSQMLDFATATGISAAEAAAFATRGLNQFGMDHTLENVVKVTDSMTYAVNQAQLTVIELGESMEYAGGMAAQYGQSFDDVVAGFALLGNVGITGSKAGTSYNAIFRTLAEGSDVLDKYKINVEALDGSMRSLPAIFTELGQKMDAAGIGDLDKMREMQEIFKRLGVKGAIIGVREVDKLKKMATDMMNIEGYTKEVAGIMDGGIGGALKRFVSAIDGIAIVLGNLILPTVESVSKVIADWLNRLAPVLATMSELGPLVLGIFAALAGSAVALLTFAGITTVLGSAFAGLASIVTGIGAILGGIVALGGAIAAMPIAAVLALVAGIVVQAELLGMAFRKAKDVFGEFMDGIAVGSKGIVAALELGEFEAAWELTMDTMTLAALSAIEEMDAAWKDHFAWVASGGAKASTAVKDFFGLGQYTLGYISAAVQESAGAPDGTVEAFDEDFTRNLSVRRQAEQEFLNWVNGVKTVSEREERLRKKVAFTQEYLRQKKLADQKKKAIEDTNKRVDKGAKPFDNSEAIAEAQREVEKAKKAAKKAEDAYNRKQNKLFEKVNFDTLTTTGAAVGGSAAQVSANLAKGMNQLMQDQLGTLVRIEKELKTDRPDKGIWMP